MRIIEVTDEHQIQIVERLAKEIWEEYYAPIIGKPQVDYMLAKFQTQDAIARQIQEGFLYYLIEDETKNHIGYAGVLIREGELFLNRIYLQARHRGKGYGRQAMQFIEKLAKEHKCSKITLTVNKNNAATIQVYKRFGFVNIAPLVQDIGHGFVMDDYKMEKAVQK